MNEALRTILNLPEQASSVAREIDGLHYFVILVTMGGALFVSLLAGFYILRYRAGSGRYRPEPPDGRPYHPAGDTALGVEIAIILGLLTLFITWWVIGFRQFVWLQVAPKGALEIHVVAKKWMWSFTYADGSQSNGVLYVPAGRPVKLIMSSRDVIHSFYVPAFRIKQDVVPGRTTTVWFEAKRPGNHDIFCAEYCGMGHSTMRGSVSALSGEGYAERLAALAGDRAAAGSAPESAAGVSLVAMGERVAAVQGCLRCHTVDGAPHIGPSWANVYGSVVPLASGKTIEVDEAYLTESMMDPMAKIRAGYPEVMPSYRGLLDAGEVGALVEYIKQLADVSPETRQAPLAPARTRVELPGAPATRPSVEASPGPPTAPLEQLPAVRPRPPPYPPSPARIPPRAPVGPRAGEQLP